MDIESINNRQGQIINMNERENTNTGCREKTNNRSRENNNNGQREHEQEMERKKKQTMDIKNIKGGESMLTNYLSWIWMDAMLNFIHYSHKIQQSVSTKHIVLNRLMSHFSFFLSTSPASGAAEIVVSLILSCFIS